MINCNINAELLEKRMDSLANEFPKEFRTGLLSAARHFVKEIKNGMKSGAPAGKQVEKLNPITQDRNDYKRQKGYGGKLQNAVSFQKENFGKGQDPGVLVGYTASRSAAKAAERMQTERNEPVNTVKGRWYFHRMAGIMSKYKKTNLQAEYLEILRVGHKTQPERDFVVAYMDQVGPEVLRIIRRTMADMLQRKRKGKK